MLFDIICRAVYKNTMTVRSVQVLKVLEITFSVQKFYVLSWNIENKTLITVLLGDFQNISVTPGLKIYTVKYRTHIIFWFITPWCIVL